MVTNCYWLLKKILEFTSKDVKDPMLFPDSNRQHKPLYVKDNQLPSRRTDVNFSAYSSVKGGELICRSDSRFEVWGTKGYDLRVKGRNHRLPGYSGIDLNRSLNSTEEVLFKISRSIQKSDDNILGNKYLAFFFKDDVRTNCFIYLASHISYLKPLVEGSCGSSLFYLLQLDFPELVASHWLIPAVVAISGKRLH